MRYNRLGNTGLFVSELSLGTMTFGTSGQYSLMGTVEQADADLLLSGALEAGVNFVDTADTYSGGNSERITGQAIRNVGVKREDIVVATKVFGETGAGPNGRGSSRAHIMDACRASLSRLQLDHIDLYQLHGFDPATPIEETLRTLHDLVTQGLVRYIGVSNWAAWQISTALGVSALHDITKFASLQAYYTVAGRDAEREIVPMLLNEGLGMLVWSPLAGGLLSGKYRRDNSSVEGSRRTAMAFPPVDENRGYNVIDALAIIADSKAVSVAQIALAWLLHQPVVTSVIIGAKRVDQLQDNLGAVNVELSGEELQSLAAASELPPEYPGWMIGMWSEARASQLRSSRHG